MNLNKYQYRNIGLDQHPDTKISIELPQDLFFCHVPLIATYTEQELSVYGIAKEGPLDDLKDNNTYKLVLVKWTLSEMIDAFSNGYRIILDNKNDAYKITNIIDEHFEKVNYILDNEDITRYEFDTRLEALDMFNKSIFTNNYGTIKSRREEIIKKASLKDLIPGVILQEVTQIRSTITTSSGTNSVNKFNTVSTVEYEDNPLKPIYLQEPVIDFERKYVSKFQNPTEHMSHIRAKQLLEKE